MRLRDVLLCEDGEARPGFSWDFLYYLTNFTRNSPYNDVDDWDTGTELEFHFWGKETKEAAVKAFDKEMPPLPAGMALYRGIKFYSHAYDRFAPEFDFRTRAAIELPAYISTTTDPAIGEHFAGGDEDWRESVLFRITTGPMSRGVVVNDINDPMFRNEHPYESEVVLRGGTFRITDRQRREKRFKDGGPGDGPIYRWNVDLVQVS